MAPVESFRCPRALLLLAYLVLALLCSLPRFGSRENEPLASSDSDCYLDMARVFNGDAGTFDTALFRAGPHHYNRPLLPFVAGWFAKWALGGDLRSAFSLLNVVAMAGTALLLGELFRHWRPQWRFAWLPGVLLLMGFPQMNWGYHLLTDSIGLATALGTAAYAAWILEREINDTAFAGATRWLHLVLLWIVSALAFLARETVLIAAITAAWLVFTQRERGWRVCLGLSVVPAVVLLGNLPHLAYELHFHVTGVPFKLPLSHLLKPAYALDFVIKTGVAFNLLWLCAGVGAWHLWRRGNLPAFLAGWAIGGVLYMLAGYVANDTSLIGYPLRMSFILFPVVFFLVELAWEEFAARRGVLVLLFGFCVAVAGVNRLGVALDDAHGKITVMDLWQRMKGRLE